MMSVTQGQPDPLGVTLVPGGVNVAVFSADAEGIEFCVFDDVAGETRFALPARTGDVHHGLVPGIAAGQLYGLRAHGPWKPEEGLRFNAARLLIDPYATRLAYPAGFTSGCPEGTGAGGFDDLALDPRDTAALMPKGMVEAMSLSSSRPASPKPASRVIYELHVKGFTKSHPGVPEALRGTLAGLTHPAALKHLTSLGVTTVELMPVAAWADERHLAPLGLTNYWGYNPVAFLAPDPRLAPAGMAEVAAAVDALHEAGLEVILDVVFNHTAESDGHGQTFSLRGLDNATYYRLADDRRFYVNDTGCGHTLALDRPPAIRLVMDALRHWALVGGVDGFRFDLAPVLGRAGDGFHPDAPLLAAIEQDPVLRERVLIAEPWDIGWGGYALGRFPTRWAEWNDRYRDDVRRFWRGDGSMGTLATRLAGSSDIFAARRRRPSSSLNFLSAHDGFTLADVVSYRGKHNEANGEDNRDGHGGEICWPVGADGESRDPAVLSQRKRDMRALMATLLLSRGTPMIGMGDEIGRSQRGNNNAYAQDNATTWIDWAGADHDFADFVAQLVKLRLGLAALIDDHFLTGTPGEDGIPDSVWLGPHGDALTAEAWNDPASRTLGLVLSAGAPHPRVLIWLHAGFEPIEIVMPISTPGRRWSLASGTAIAPPADSAATLYGSFDKLVLEPRSVALFLEEAGRASSRDSNVDPAFLDRLSTMAGISLEWWDISGHHHIVSPDTKLALLRAMGLPAATMPQAHESLERLQSLPAATTSVDTERCFMPPSLAEGGRCFGLAAHLYTLRRQGEQGIGDFTTLRATAETAAAHGAATLALNPFHMMFPSNRTRVSPYQPSDRRFLDPIYIDLTAVPEIDAAAAYLAVSAQEMEGLSALRFVDYAAVWRLKRAALSLSFDALGSRPARQVAFEAFRAAGGKALERFALFQALEEEFGSIAPRLVLPADPGAMTDARRRAMDFAIYLQFVADEQLAASARTSLAIGFYRDQAVGAAPDGAEVWSAPEAFLKGISIGAPPDPFAADGQIWGIPPLDPIGLQQTACAHLRSLLAANMRHAGALRIDHAMGLSRLFLVPEGANATEGTYVRYPREAMLRAVAEESQRTNCLVIGEDLGTVEEGFRERMSAAEILSYRVLFFERTGHTFLPSAGYPAKAVACVATHDLPTLRGWWAGADITLDRQLGRSVAPQAEAEREADKAALLQAIGQPADVPADEPLTPGIVGAVHGYLATSPAAIVLAQAEDLIGEAEPVNLPGTENEYPNWRRRLDREAEVLFETPEGEAVLTAMKAAGR